MSKYCGKCGIEMTDDDFLCPRCGAIWGDRIYRVPTVTEAQEPDTEETEVPDEPQKVRQRKQPRWLLPLVAGCILLAFVLFLIGSDWDMWAGEGSTAPSTTDHSFTIGALPTAAPPETKPAYITYTVKIVDPFGNPIPNVTLSYPNINPFISSSKVWQITDQDGGISFQYPSERVASVKVEKVPEGYTLPQPDAAYYFTDRATDLIIVVQPVLPQSYSVTMLDPAWIYEELESVYSAGEVVNVKIIRLVNNFGYMLFLNGVEIPEIFLDGGGYRLYRFIMPEEDVVLDLKVIEDRTYEDIIRNFYTLFPDAEDVEVLNYYGQYGAADVVMLKTMSAESGYASETVSGYQFLYPNQNLISVRIDGVFVSLNAAYENGFLTVEDVEDIYRLHLEYLEKDYTWEIDPA